MDTIEHGDPSELIEELKQMEIKIQKGLDTLLTIVEGKE